MEERIGLDRTKWRESGVSGRENYGVGRQAIDLFVNFVWFQVGKGGRKPLILGVNTHLSDFIS